MTIDEIKAFLKKKVDETEDVGTLDLIEQLLLKETDETFVHEERVGYGDDVEAIEKEMDEILSENSKH